MAIKKSALAALLTILFSNSAFAISDKSTTPLLAHGNATLPVLIKVNAAGKITEVSPSNPLPDDLSSLLRKNVGEMIVAPATNAAGQHVESQFLADIELVIEPLPDGQFSAHFSRPSSIKSLPNTGRWHWARTDDVQPALTMTEYKPAPIYWKHPVADFAPIPPSPSIAVAQRAN